MSMVTAIGQKDFSQRYPKNHQQDELNALGETLNQMSDELAQSYHQLEERVAEKTADLITKNRVLSYLYQSNQILHSSEPLYSRLQKVLIELKNITLLKNLSLRLYEESNDAYFHEICCDSIGLSELDNHVTRELSGRIILFTVSNYSDDLVNALKRGADGYLLKDMEPEELIVALKEAASGKLVVSPTLASVLAESLRDNTTQDENHIASLTPREADILELISQGLSNKMIARKLDIAESTVKVHVKHLLKKLNLKSRVEAAVWVLQQK
nr:LuxR C-terminal-related transcriptional regulator [Providencia sp. G1(2023)]